MTDFATIFAELVDAIDRHGECTVIPLEVQAVIDRYDMVEFERGDGFMTDLSFGVRRGDERISGNFTMYPQQRDDEFPQAVYSLQWSGFPKSFGHPLVERRDWTWDVGKGGGGRVDDNQPVFPEFQ